MKKEYLGIDLGSENTSIYSSITDSVIYSEPTCLVANKNTGEVSKIGFLASKVSGKAPYNYEVVYPIQNGAIFDDDACYLYLQEVLRNLNILNRMKTPCVVFSTYSNCSKVNRKSLIEIGKLLGAKEIYIESQARLAALGSSNNVFAPTSTFVCHIGAGVSDIACLSMGEIVACESTSIASCSFDEAIRRYMMQNQHLSIGLNSAEYLKMKIASLEKVPENKLSEIKGRDTITSLPSSSVVSTSELKGALEALADIIILKITDVISSMPPELVSDLTKTGIYLSGGGSLLKGLKEYFERKLFIPVNINEKPLDAINEGFKVYSRFIK